ncbi:hypothetical protein BDQ17DRAFT_1380976 [Cyathus striatus]|nr:hypothetical protein BDQ17DRAFT_1382732 [Cyathus striatus]KAF8980092.1 hypothetical protein BDQ17DRAFT_1380976 [Cyathus striatus]
MPFGTCLPPCWYFLCRRLKMLRRSYPSAKTYITPGSTSRNSVPHFTNDARNAGVHNA